MQSFQSKKACLHFVLVLIFSMPIIGLAQPDLVRITPLPAQNNSMRSVLTWGNGDTLIVAGFGRLQQRTTKSGSFSQNVANTQDEISNLATAVNSESRRRIWFSRGGEVVVVDGNSVTGSLKGDTLGSGFPPQDIAALGDSAFVVRPNDQMIYKYSFDGNSLTEVSSSPAPSFPIAINLFGIDINPNTNVGIAVGSEQFWARSTNGGANWSSQAPLPTTGEPFSFAYDFYEVQYAGGSTWYIGGGIGEDPLNPGEPLAEGVLFKSTDDGATWERTGFIKNNGSINSLGFISPDTGFISSGAFNQGFILLTTDGGTGTVPAYSEPNFFPFDISALSSDFVYGVGGLNSIIQPKSITASKLHELKSLRLKLYPNPTTGLLNIEGELNEETSLRVMNLTGQVLLTETLDASERSIDISTLPQGIYLVELQTEAGRSTARIIKQ